MTPPSSHAAPHLEGRARLRVALRTRRRALEAPERAAAAARVLHHLERLRWLRPGRFIAAYAAIDGELDPRPIVNAARARRCHVYLPRITARRHARMRFLPAGHSRSINRYGIEEPAAGAARAARGFDLILLPLVAFDRHGARLGMGAGYYDRALAFRRLRRTWRGPRLVGLGYAFQEVPALPLGVHDIRLDAVITERGVRFFRGE